MKLRDSKPLRVTTVLRVVILINENGFFCLCKAEKSMIFHVKIGVNEADIYAVYFYIFTIFLVI